MHAFFEFLNQPRPHIDKDTSKWPKEWSTIYFKSYPRLDQIKLPEPDLGNFSLKESILKRESKRDFSGKAINLKDLSTFLFYSSGIIRGERNESHRTYPSGGARYPLEVYISVFNVEGLNPGFYHYSVKNHALEKLTDDKDDIEEFKKSFYYEFVKNASFVIMISIIPWRSSIKYGNFAFKVGLIEAGHLGQNFYLLSQALGFKCCALGGIKEEMTESFLDLDGVIEKIFYALSIGK